MQTRRRAGGQGWLIGLLLATGVTMAGADSTTVAALGEEALRAVKAFYDYDPGIPLSSRVVERIDEAGMRRDKVTFRGVRSFWVPGLLELPRDRPGPYPCVLLLHGWSWSKECWYGDDNYVSGGNLRRALLAAGFAVFALDAPMHGDRIAENDYAVVNVWPGDGPAPQRNYFTLSEVCEQAVRDYRRGLDYLATRPEIDMGRVGAFGYSMGAWQVFPLCAVEPRVRVAVAAALPTERPNFETLAPQSYVKGINQPFLLQIGRQDEMATQAGAERLYDLVAASTKELVWYDGGHSLPASYVSAAVAWFAAHL
jgi:dienelactone hydrolase